VGVLFRHLMHTVAPACFAASIFCFLHRTHAPKGALSVRETATCMSLVLMCVTGRVLEIADSTGHPRVMAIRRAITKIPQEVPSVCWTDFQTALDLGGSLVGNRGGSARRESVS
jgi:hypothetical protein